jgi:hypothetical protein
MTQQRHRLFLRQISQTLALDPHVSTVPQIAERMRSLNSEHRSRALALCQQALYDTAVRKHEAARVVAVKVLTASPSQTEGVIRRWLGRRSGRFVREVHFSLFCFLDELLNLPDGRKLARAVPSLVERYLLEATSSASHAAWMAGDLLGDHWQSGSGLAVLMRVARRGQHKAGRMGALHGLAHALDHVTGPTKDRIRRLLRDVSRSDQSAEARALARSALERRPA